MDLVCSSRRDEVAGLRQESPEALLGLTGLPRLEELELPVDPTAADWLWHATGLRLLDGRGASLRLGFVLRSVGGRHTGYAVLADLDDPRARADIMSCCAQHVLAAVDPERSQCVERVFHDYELHALKVRPPQTRTWLRLAALLANSPIVSVGRSRQSRGQ